MSAALAWPGGDPLPPVTRIELRRMGNGWGLRARCGGVTIRAVYALTVPAAVWKFRFARREALLVDEALGP